MDIQAGTEPAEGAGVAELAERSGAAERGR
jgi:hypothetical protein